MGPPAPPGEPDNVLALDHIAFGVTGSEYIASGPDKMAPSRQKCVGTEGEETAVAELEKLMEGSPEGGSRGKLSMVSDNAHPTVLPVFREFFSNLAVDRGLALGRSSLSIAGACSRFPNDSTITHTSHR